MNAQLRLYHFDYGDERISYQRVTRPQNQHKIQIKVYPDCRVVVAAPEHASDDAVLHAVRQRSRWIYQQLRTFRQQLEFISPRRYVSGESHYYLGKQYQLKVLVDAQQAQGVKLLRGTLEVTLSAKNDNSEGSNNSRKVQQLLTQWYKTRAKMVFERRLDDVLTQTLWVTQRPVFRILTMQTQWGSCSPRGLLTLNPHLVKAPTQCIDYVILHELCHLAEHNHSERFYHLMTQVMPNWQKIKNQLDSMASRLLVVG